MATHSSEVKCPECGNEEATLVESFHRGLPDLDVYCLECGFTWGCVEGKLDPEDLEELRNDQEKEE